LFAALRRVPGYPTPRPEPRRRYVPVERSPEELTSDSLDDKYGNMRGALRQVAEVLLDLGADDTQLLGRLAAFRDHERSLARLEAAQDALEHEATAVRETVGDRESSLRFALGELRFVASERPEDLERSHELEVRLQTAVADADRANALDESIMSVAALRAENLDRLRIAYDALLGVVDDILPEFATNPALAPLVERLDAVRARRK
jgi:hypothetical protein